METVTKIQSNYRWFCLRSFIFVQKKLNLKKRHFLLFILAKIGIMDKGFLEDFILKKVRGSLKKIEI